MPRQTTSLQHGSRIMDHAPATPQIKWFSVFLVKCIIQTTSDTRFVYDKAQSRSDKQFLLNIGLDINDPSRFIVQIKDDSGDVYLHAAVPSLKSDLEIRLFESEYTIDVRHFKKGSQVLLSRWTFYLEVNTPSIAGKVKRGWNSLSQCLMNMSVNQLRYVNIPRPLHLLDDASSSASRYAFRQQQSLVSQSRSDPSAVTIDLPSLGVKLTYTGTIASPQFQALCEWIEFRRKPPVPQTSIASLPMLTEEEQQDPGLLDERARQLRKLSNDSNTVCSQCYKTGVPVEPGKIRARRDRKEWIGCQNGEACKSHNFWFHLTEECAGFTSAQASKKMRWWCVECRKERPRANSLGLEQRPGARE